MAASPMTDHATAWRDGAVSADVPAIDAESERAREHLQHLVTMRLAAILAMLVTVAAADRLLGVVLPVATIGAVLTALAVFNALTHHRLREARPVTDAELLGQLSVDTAALTAVLALSGGAANPFAGIILLPLAVGAWGLSRLRGWTLAFESIAAYAVLLFVAEPIAMNGHEADRMMLISAGLWISYSITAGVIATVLVRATLALRRGEQIIEGARRKAACDEHILRIGALAAGAAHELASPLGSIATIVDDLRRAPPGSGDLGHDLEVIARQLASCRETLSTLLCYGNSAFCSPAERLALDELMRSVIEAFAARREGPLVALRCETPGKAPLALSNRALRQALTNLLDNAADASPRPIDVALSWDAQWLHIRIRDRGPGVPGELVDRVGRLLFYTTKERGRGSGLGLYLANTAVTRLGGTLEIGNAPDEGTMCHVRLPATSALAP